MPRGAASFQRHQETVAKQREEQQALRGPQVDYFGIDAGQGAVVRFLEQGETLMYGFVHRVPVAGQTYAREYMCLDQREDGTPCPFCQSEFRGIRNRTTKGYVNLIWRGNVNLQQVNAARRMQGQPEFTLGPVYRRNEWGSPEKVDGPMGRKIPVIVGFDDRVHLWKCSKSAYQVILSADTHLQGLMSRDVIISRTGSGPRDTVYTINPYEIDGGPQPMLAADMMLMANKYDLDEVTRPLTYDQAMLVASGGDVSQGPQPTFDRGGGQSGFGGGFGGQQPVAPQPAQQQPWPQQQPAMPPAPAPQQAPMPQPPAPAPTPGFGGPQTGFGGAAPAQPPATPQQAATPFDGGAPVRSSAFTRG